MRKYFSVIFVLFLSMNAGCDQRSNYSSDGKFLDRGSDAATNRYVLDLGKVPLDSANKKGFVIKGLPDGEYTLGLMFYKKETVQKLQDYESEIFYKRLNALIKMELRDKSGHKVIDAIAPLKDWVWSYPGDHEWAFIYVRENDSSYFYSRASKRFNLVVEVIEGDVRLGDVSARVIAQGGGWK